MSGQAFARMARYADGYAHGGGPAAGIRRRPPRGPRPPGRSRPPGAAAPLGPGLLLLRRRRPRRRVPAGLLRLHRPVRGEDRGRRTSRARGPSRTSSAATRRRAATSSSSSPPSPTPTSSSRLAGGARVRVEIVGGGPAGLYLGILLQEGRPRRSTSACSSGTRRMRRSAGASSSARRRSARCATPIPRRTWRSRTRSRAGTGSTSATAAASCAREVTRSRRSRASGCSRSCSGVAARSGSSSSSASRSTSCRRPISSSGRTARTRFVRGLGEFGTKVEPEGSKYVWFGTDHVFDAFTFVFRRPSTGSSTCTRTRTTSGMSTFIVECPRDVWRARRARRAWTRRRASRSASSCSRAISAAASCSRTARSGSTSRRSRTPIWHDGRVVLLGDAAHTAHFSIGSGTKLAMEDSIALANALARRGWDVEAALVDYELERGPVVERTQEAASESAGYFGRVASYSHLEPIQFAFNLLTRSGRITHASLGDPRPAVHARARRLVRRFSGLAAAGVLAVRAPRRPVREPVRPRAERGRRGLRRGSSHAGDADGRRVEPSVAAGAPPTRPCRPARRDAATIGRSRPAALGRLAGRRSDAQALWPVQRVPGEPDEDGDPRAVRRGGATGRRAQRRRARARHGARLPARELPLAARRIEEDDRLRFPLSVLDAVREVWPGALAVRLSVTDWHPRGNSVERRVAIARALAEARLPT